MSCIICSKVSATTCLPTDDCPLRGLFGVADIWKYLVITVLSTKKSLVNLLNNTPADERNIVKENCVQQCLEVLQWPLMLSDRNVLIAKLEKRNTPLQVLNHVRGLAYVPDVVRGQQDPPLDHLDLNIIPLPLDEEEVENPNDLDEEEVENPNDLDEEEVENPNDLEKQQEHDENPH